ncbi:MAG: hypothetical protein JRC93_01805 [Deltaproteobacteria bacterium]|nr:hypothetical protein [Deltaproteobacteria bacterium]
MKNAIGLRHTVDSYIIDVRAVTRMGLDIKIFRMNRLGISQDGIAKRSGQTRDIIRLKRATTPKSP